MAAGKMQRLALKDLDVVLKRAKAERWKNLALLEWDEVDHHALWLTRNGFRPEEVLLLYEPVRSIPPALTEVGSLVALSITRQEIGDAGAEVLSRLKDLTFLYLPHNQIGDSGAEAIARLRGLTQLHLGGNRIGPSGAAALASLQNLTSLMLGGNQIGDGGVEAITRLEGLTTLDLSRNQISDAGAKAITKLKNLTTLDLGRNQIGNAGAESLAQSKHLRSHLTSVRLNQNLIGPAGAAAIAQLSSLTSLVLGGNQIGDTGAKAITDLSGLTRLHLDDNQIGDAGVIALAGCRSLDSLGLGRNRIGDGGARAIAMLEELTALHLTDNQIGKAGGRAILDAWADPKTSDRRLRLGLRGNEGLAGLLPEEVLRDSDAQVIIAAWRQRKAQEAGRAPLPAPEAAGEPVAHGVQVGTAADGWLTLVDPAAGAGARDDAIGRELHGEVIVALDRLIGAARSSNGVVEGECRLAAAEAKERLGGAPAEVRVSAILRIERLRSLREADERRRVEPDPLVEPAEAGVAAALRDAVAAANLYVETDPYLAEQQRRLADPVPDLGISTEEAAEAEAEMEALGIADAALLEELRAGRETASAGGRAGERASAWLAGSWRNVVREMLRQVLAWVREQAKVARGSAGEAAMQATLGAVITIDEAAAVLASIGLRGRQAVSSIGQTVSRGAGLSTRAFAISLGTAAGAPIPYGTFAWLENQFAILPALGFPPEFVAKMHRLLFLAG
jgi:Ran GTPase-activating protein (RanGAP) involved in mRNA processing and transport